MVEIEFYDVVLIKASDKAIALGVANLEGVVVGKSGEQGQMSYAVLVGDRTYMIDAPDLDRTGERVSRSSVYGGESIRVDPQRYENNDRRS
jgi:hypothetical protein